MRAPWWHPMRWVDDPDGYASRAQAGAAAGVFGVLIWRAGLDAALLVAIMYVCVAVIWSWWPR